MPVAKSFRDLVIEDVEAFPVWRHKPAQELKAGEDESWVVPVKQLPVRDAFDHYFVTTVALPDATSEVVLIGKTEPSNAESNARNQLFVFFRAGAKHVWTNNPSWFSPEAANVSALASFLGKQVSDIFPFEYDLSGLLEAIPAVTQRSVQPKPIVQGFTNAVDAAMATAEESLAARSRNQH